MEFVLPLLAISQFYDEWELPGGWLSLAIGAVIVAVIFNTIFMMVGRAFSIRELEAFGKSEILQAAATAFMAIFLVMMVQSAMEVAQEVIHGDLVCGGEAIEIGKAADTTMDDAYAAIRCRLQQRAISVSAVQDTVSTGAGTYGDYFALNSVVTLFGLQIFKGDWISSLYKSVETDRITNSLATVLLIGLNAQSALLQYLQYNMLQVFIPVGILLRSFYFTRGVGALFIAVGVGMYFIFPIIFVLLDPGFVASPLPPPSPQPAQPYCYATMTNTITVLDTLEASGLGSTGGLLAEGVSDNLTKSYMSLMLHPLIALFLTLVFIRYIMAVLGGDTYAITRMVTKLI